MWLQLLMNGLIAGSTYALIALGFALVFAVARFFHFAHAALVTVGAYAAVVLMSQTSAPLAVAVLVAIGASTALGLGIEIVVYRPLRSRGAKGTLMLLASLGAYVALQNAISLLFGDDVRSINAFGGIGGVRLWSASLTGTQCVILATDVALYAAVGLFLARSPLGKRMRALACDPELSAAVGIDQNRTMMMVFAIGSALAGVAGVLIGCDTAVSPTMGFRALLMGVVSAVVGGVGSVAGALVGGLLVGLVQHLVAGGLPTQWADATVFVLLAVFLVARPQGILGRPRPASSV